MKDFYSLNDLKHDRNLSDFIANSNTKIYQGEESALIKTEYLILYVKSESDDGIFDIPKALLHALNFLCRKNNLFEGGENPELNILGVKVDLLKKERINGIDGVEYRNSLKVSIGYQEKFYGVRVFGRRWVLWVDEGKECLQPAIIPNPK